MSRDNSGGLWLFLQEFEQLAMISGILYQAEQDIEGYLTGDDRGYAAHPDLCDQISQLLQDMKALRERLDSPVEPAPDLSLPGRVKLMIDEYLNNGDSAKFKAVLEQIARQVGKV